MNKITKNKKLLVRTFIIVGMFILSFTHLYSFNDDPSSIDINSSVYKYSAVENTLSYFDLIKDNENLNQIKQMQDEQQIDDFTKKLENVTERQNFSTKKIEESIHSINDKSRLRAFVIGNNLGILKFQMVQIKDEINLLEDLYLETEDTEYKIRIEQQLKLLEEIKLKVENFILDQNNKFSLFGWFVIKI